MKSYLIVLLAVAIVLVTSPTPNSPSKTLWPYPLSFKANATAVPFKISPCELKFTISSPNPGLIQELIDIYLIQVFKCSKVPTKNITIAISVKNITQLIALNVTHQKYSIVVRQSQKWDITADYYVGFVRAFETFSQLFVKSNGSYVVDGIPLTIDDQPQFFHRGLMIDTSRHYLPISTIKKTIDGLMYDKLNVLHWHMTDEDAFPMEVKTRPELSEYGQVGGVYTYADIKNVINYALARGIRVIPQVDTPAHSQSWGRSFKYQKIVLTCSHDYEGQFDPTMDLTYEVIGDVLAYTNTTFIDSYVHFGGDEIDPSCWDQRPAIKSFMEKNNITTYQGLEVYFRKREKNLWRTINKQKKVIYWANEDIDLPLEADDVIQWWGSSANVKALQGQFFVILGRKNEVILSNYDLTYLDIGFGNRYGSSYGHMQEWRKMYTFNPRITNVNVIGGEVCMWGELSNQWTHEQKVWNRASIIGERLWNDKLAATESSVKNVAQRLITHSARFRERGFKVRAVTVGLCETNTTICFP